MCMWVYIYLNICTCTTAHVYFERVLYILVLQILESQNEGSCQDIRYFVK